MNTKSKANWRPFAELIAVISVVLSLLFVGFELRLNRSIANSEGVGLSMELSINVIQLIAENSDLWGRGCLGEELTQEEDIRFANIVNAVNEKLIYQFVRSDEGIATSSGAEQRAPLTLALHLHNFPGFKRAWTELHRPGERERILRERGTLSGWEERVQEQLEYLESNNVEKDMSIASCGH